MTEPAYRWVIVAAGGLMGCVAMGAMFSLPVLLTPIAADTGWSRTGISAAMTIGFLSMAVTSMVWGAASDRFGARPVVLGGAGLFSAALFLAGQAPTLVLFQLAFGLLVGGAVAAFFAPLMATVTGWFATRRSLAVSLVSAGMGLAPVTMSPLAARLAEGHDWRTVLTILAAIVAVTTLPAALLLRPPPAAAIAEPGPGPGPEARPAAGMTLRQAVATPQFAILIATNFLCCATHSGPIFHTVSYAEICGLSALAAVSIYSVEGIAGMGGRIGFGLMGDRFGARRVLVIGLLAQAFGALAYVAARGLIEFYVVAALFGFLYAGIMPLYNVLVRESFPMAIMGAMMGGLGMAGSLGMAIGPLLGGYLYDVTGSYAGLYVVSFALGLGAFLIGATFRPLPKAEPAAAAQPA